MNKPNPMGGFNSHAPDRLLPLAFDEDVVTSFFAQGKGLGKQVKEILEAASGEDAPSIGASVSAAAKLIQNSDTSEVDTQEVSGIELSGYLSTDEADLMDHMDDHDHTHDEHDHEHSEMDHPDFDGFAEARGGKGGKKTDDGSTTDGGGGKGRGKNKVVEETDEVEPAPEPTPDPEPAPDPEPTPAPEPDPTPEPAPEPTPEPEPTPAPSTEFGWLNANTYLSGGDTPDGFNVELVFDGFWSDSQKDMAAQQAEILSDIIIGDLPDYGDIDDVRIKVSTWEIDGSGGTWGIGGYSQLTPDGMVAEGGIYLDPADIGTAEGREMLDELMMHEMMHAIGFGTTWDQNGLTSNGTFTGENAVDVYGSAVPIDGNGHLSESVGNEMGTTYISNNAEPITDLTLAILEDMGFETIYEPPVEEEEESVEDFLLL
ncbi:hypothetical protein [Tateyamaria sp.]|jgi:hypothetical protein|uniref:hypothetical protein n=1 Tax=Tateyamaria sp. TaxID=1929288 RepID=UPI0032DD90B3